MESNLFPCLNCSIVYICVWIITHLNKVINQSEVMAFHLKQKKKKKKKETKKRIPRHSGQYSKTIFLLKYCWAKSVNCKPSIHVDRYKENFKMAFSAEKLIFYYGGHLLFL